MSEPELSSSQKSYLSDCRLVAAENYVFYECVYDRLPAQFNKEVVGRVMAQKKEFIDVVESLLEGGEDDGTASIIPATQSLVFTLPVNNIDEVNSGNVWDFVKIHEDRFKEAVAMTMDVLDDKTTVELLRHHAEAAQIAKKALLEDK